MRGFPETMDAPPSCFEWCTLSTPARDQGLLGTYELRLRGGGCQSSKPLDVRDVRLNEADGRTASSASSTWSIDAWLASLDLHQIVATALAPPLGEDPFSYAKTKLEDEVKSKLEAAKLEGLLPYLLDSIAALKRQTVATASELNEKFAVDGSIELTYGSMRTFNAGLEGFIGPPCMAKESEALQRVSHSVLGTTTSGPTLLGQMEEEHCRSPDSHVPFPSQKGDVIVRPAAQWAFVMNAAPEESTSNSRRRNSSRPADVKDNDDDGTFSLRGRVRKPLSEHWALVKEKNALLAAQQNPELVLEEVVAAQLYTCPMYLKYNAVLRFISGNRALQDQCVKYKLGEWEVSADRFRWLAQHKYATTIHAINSCVVKLSALTAASTVYRGVAQMRLPKRFFVKDPMTNIAGGVEYGFSSTTRDRATAVFYAKETDALVASTILKAQMGMVDRGADIGFLSQFPGEQEILYGPLMGMEVRGTHVNGSTLVIEVVLSTNQKSLTLEQVARPRDRDDG